MLYPVIRKTRFDRIGIWIYGIASGKVRLGIYNCDDELYPSTLAVDVGERDNVSALGEITIDQTLDKGNYFLAFILDASNDLFLEATVYQTPIRHVALLTHYAGYFKTMTYGALPSTYPSEASLEPWLYAVSLRMLEHLT